MKCCFFTENEKWLLQFLGSVSMTAELPAEFYEKIRERYAEQLATIDKEELHINAQWAMQFLGYGEE